MLDLIAMRLRRAAVAAQVMMPDVMLMGILAIGSFKQRIVNTETWLSGLVSWPKRLYVKESMTFCKQGFDIPTTTKQLPALRAMLPGKKCYNNLFAVGIDFLMGALESLYCAGSYALMIRPVQRNGTRGRTKESSRYEMLWVLKNFNMGHAEFFVRVISIAGIEVTSLSHGMFDIDGKSFEMKEALAVEKIVVPVVVSGDREHKIEATCTSAKIEANLPPPIPLTPAPSIPMKAKKTKPAEPSVHTIPVSISDPTTSVPTAPETPAAELPNKPALPMDVQLLSVPSVEPDPTFKVHSMLGNSRQKCARVRLPQGIIRLYR